jgi:FixJ family two-component response regulator
VDVKDLIAAIQRAVTKDTHDLASEARLAEVQRRVGLLTPREVEVFAHVVSVAELVRLADGASVTVSKT